VLSQAVNAGIRFFLAPACAACSGPLDHPLAGPVCAACWRAVSRLTPPCCAQCGDTLPPGQSADARCARCRQSDGIVALARSAGRYDGSLREIIHAFKYEGRRALASPLAALMKTAGAEVLAGADALVPVPLHPWRALRRGFNQADDLARRLGLPVWPVLRRRRFGPSQASLPASARYANVRDAYALRRAPRLAGRLRGRVLVLVDDVMTTGATVEACAGVLVASGVRCVRVLTIARAVAELHAPLPPTRRPSTARRR